MYNRTLIPLIGLIALSMATPGLAQDSDVDQRIETEQNRWDVYQGGVVTETARRNALQEQSERARVDDRSAARFINPHPELGCLYYDENNVRRWFRYCREL